MAVIIFVMYSFFERLRVRKAVCKTQGAKDGSVPSLIDFESIKIRKLKMKSSKALALLLLAIAPIAAFASDGTINFTGKITDQTCKINAAQGKDLNVTLPTVAASSLGAQGAVAGRTQFAINLSECKPGQVATFFEPGATVDLESGRLNNQAADNPAKQVQIQLLGSNGNVLKVRPYGDNNAQENSQWVTVDKEGMANLDYYAEYYATAAATAGAVSTSVKYTIIYN